MDAKAWARWWRLRGRSDVIRILATEWDPIGLGAALPSDEYACTADAVAGRLRRGVDVADLAAALTTEGIDHFGMTATAKADQRAAAALLFWYTEGLVTGSTVSPPDREVVVVREGTWIYDGTVESPVRIVRQNWDYQFELVHPAEVEPGGPHLNEDGYAYYAEFGEPPTSTQGASRFTSRSHTCLSVQEAVAAAESALPPPIRWIRPPR